MRWARETALLALVATIPLVATTPAPPVTGRARARPNVLIILTDDQRPDGTLGVMRKTRRWLVRTGVRYLNAYATTPVCCPSRASIMTGRYAHNHRVQDNQSPYQLDQASTLQRYLQGAGYFTALVGKFLNGWDPSRNPPYFHRWSLFSPLEFGPGYRRNVFNVDGRLRLVPRYSTDYIAERARSMIRWFERRDGRPWLLYVHPFAPHGPSRPAKRYGDARTPRWRPNPSQLEADRADKPLYVQQKSATFTAARVVRRRQLRTLMSVDDLVETLRLELRKRRESRDTVVMFLSDNGYTWRDHGWIDKRLPYTQSIKVPFLVRWPGRLPGGVVETKLVANVDIVPTVLRAAGVTPDPAYPLDGRSLLAPPRDHVMTEYWSNSESPIPTWASIRGIAYQYIETYDDDSGEVLTREYYDLLTDPHQLTNLLGDPDPANDPPSERVAELSLALQRERECQGTEGPDACP